MVSSTSKVKNSDNLTKLKVTSSVLFAFTVAALFVTLVGESASGMLGLVADMLNVYRVSERDTRELDTIIYYLNIGYWTLWAWFGVFILFIIIMWTSFNKWLWGLVLFGFLACSIIVGVVGALAANKIHQYQAGAPIVDQNVLGSAKYFTLLATWLSWITFLVLLVIGATGLASSMCA